MRFRPGAGRPHLPSPAVVLRSLGLMVDCGTGLEDGLLLACACPRRDASLAALAGQGISLLINLHEPAHHPPRLARHGLRQIHLPVPDFTAPSPDQLDRGVAAIAAALEAGHRVAVHCGGGLGRTGTLTACYLVAQGLDADAAIARVRALRPGSIETCEQAAAVAAYARRHLDSSPTGPSRQP